MLKHRLLFGLLFIACLVGLFYLDSRLSAGWPAASALAPPGTVLAILILILTPLALREMQAMLSQRGVEISVGICVVAAVLCMLWPWVEQAGEQARLQTIPGHAVWTWIGQHVHTVRPHYLIPTIMAATLVVAIAMHARLQRIEGTMANAGATLLAVVYLGVLPGFFLPICLKHGSWMVLGVIAVVKAADIGAYATGRLIGRHKLIPWLSPGKTVEGFFGGLALAGAAGAIVAALVPDFTWPQGVVAGIILGAVGQAGDLLESLLKRDAGVKDSGRVPGFGGVLDLLDSPLLAAPVAYWMLKLLGSN